MPHFSSRRLHAHSPLAAAIRNAIACLAGGGQTPSPPHAERREAGSSLAQAVQRAIAGRMELQSRGPRVAVCGPKSSLAQTIERAMANRWRPLFQLFGSRSDSEAQALLASL
jgi:hypothetical protein